MSDQITPTVDTDAEFRVASTCLRLLAERDALRAERDGERKAKELALKGLESVTELYDRLKHKVRGLESDLADAVRDRQLLAAEGDRLAKEVERLRAALKRYGCHERHCPKDSYIDRTCTCTCGLAAALEETKS